MSTARTLGRNTAMRYGALFVDVVVGLVLLPYNLGHLGATDYGLWVLSASVARYVSFLDLGFGGGLVRFVAECRATGDHRRLSEIASTTFAAFAVASAVAMVFMTTLAFAYERVFAVTAAQATVGRIVLLIVATRLIVGLPLSVFGAVINGAQRYALNNAVSIATTVFAAAANVIVIERGGGVVSVVLSTTVVHLAAYVAYVTNAHRVQPGLRVSPRLASVARLREIGAFSGYLLVLDWSHKINYSLDPFVIGWGLGPGAVAQFTPAVRVAQSMRDLTAQFQTILFPAVVDLRTRRDQRRLMTLLVEGTRLSTALAIAVGLSVIVLAEPLLVAWIGPSLASSALVLQVLTLSMLARVAHGTAATILKGSGGHRYLALNNAVVALFNIVLSITLVRRLGLLGVALGTAIPVSIGALLVMPRACHRLDVPVRTFFQQAIWPVIWPALPTSVAVWALREAMAPHRLLPILAIGAAGAAFYLALVYSFGLTVDARATLQARLKAAVV